MTKNKQKGTSALAFLAGLVSTLFVPTPVGYVSMLDGASYFLAIPVFFSQYQTYNIWFKRFLALGALWVLNATISDIIRGVPLLVAFKAEMIILNSLTIAIVGMWLVRKSPRALLWFIVGNAISQVISLYHFQNGAYISLAMKYGYNGGTNMSEFLIDKQIFPIWVNMYLMAGVVLLRIFFRLPWVFCISSFLYGGVFLLTHGGSRSNFLIMLSAAFVMAAYAYWHKIFEFIFRRKLVALIGVAVMALFFKAAYYALAEAGYLGETGYQKIEEKKSGKAKAMDNRPDLIANWPFLWRSPIIGAGSLFKDKWGYLKLSGFSGYINDYGQYCETDTFFGHSCIVGAWTANGIFGLIFWFYVFWLMFEFLGRRVYVLGDAGPFVIYAIIGLMWNIAFSPYGIFRGLAMFTVAFLCSAKDPRFLNWVAQVGLTAKERKSYIGRELG